MPEIVHPAVVMAEAAVLAAPVEPRGRDSGVIRELPAVMPQEGIVPAPAVVTPPFVPPAVVVPSIVTPPFVPPAVVVPSIVTPPFVPPAVVIPPVVASPFVPSPVAVPPVFTAYPVVVFPVFPVVPERIVGLSIPSPSAPIQPEEVVVAPAAVEPERILATTAAVVDPEGVVIAGHHEGLLAGADALAEFAASRVSRPLVTAGGGRGPGQEQGDRDERYFWRVCIHGVPPRGRWPWLRKGRAIAGGSRQSPAGWSMEREGPCSRRKSVLMSRTDRAAFAHRGGQVQPRPRRFSL